MKKIADISFSSAEVEAFKNASHDLNPLHADAEYARTTPFSRPVVYGILAVLKSLAGWRFPSSEQLQYLRVAFKKPFFQGESYELHGEERQGKTFLFLRRGPVDYMHLMLKTAALPFEKGHSGMAFLPLAESQTGTPTQGFEASYMPDSRALPELRALLGIGQNSLSDGQVSAFLWSSYQVGMVLPGRQALFGELEMEFGAAMHGAGIRLDIVAADFDPRFNRINMRGVGTGITRLRIGAFQRPEPVAADLANWETRLTPSDVWRGKKVLVSGAGRGFGAAMAVVAGLKGARVGLNYRTAGAELDRLAAFLEARGVEVLPLQGDLTKVEEVEEMKEKIEKEWGSVDLLVNNAFPAIRNLFFFEQELDEFTSFLDKTMRISLLTARHLLPLLHDDGTWLQVSTEYVSEPQKGFSHYHTAKSAQEALCQSLSLEHPQWRFWAARLPQMLTDQTNLPFHLSPPASPVDLADRLFQALETESPDNFHILKMD